VADYGLDDFELSMQAQYELTQRFTAEFSIRPYLMLYPEQTLARLQTWATDSSVHVRRLVSEGTRPRLPWAPRLRSFQENPQPVLALLELLKDDPELYVRRSVANNLNDIGKDNPDVLIETTQRWLQNATPERRWLVTHALRSALKRGDANALKVMGFGTQSHIEVCHVVIAPQHVYTGESVKIRFDVVNAGTETQRLLIDLGIYFVKRYGGNHRKVFKLKTVELAAAESIRLAKTISLQEMTTRTHYAGVHRVEAIVNGEPTPLGQFVLSER
jgi:3-methyladenine DNA glycosylase AlkC